MQKQVSTPSEHQPSLYPPEGQLPPPVPLHSQTTWGRQILHVGADISCLIIGWLVFLWTHDILAFLLLYGIATGQIHVREIIGMLLLRFQKTGSKLEEASCSNEE